MFSLRFNNSDQNSNSLAIEISLYLYYLGSNTEISCSVLNIRFILKVVLLKTMETVKQNNNEIIRDAFLLGKVNDHQMGKFFSQRKENEVRVRENTVGSEELAKRGSNCEICKKKFRSRYHLNMHMPVHTGEKNYMCDVCRKSYQQKWNLITHVARVHAKEKPFKCKDCGKAFGYSSHFKRHVKSHLVESMEVPKKVKERILNPYSCNVCGKSFDSKYRLELHIRKHYGIRPFMCDKCGMGFTTRRLINIHLSKHDVKEYVCDRCGLSFRDRREIMHHMKQGRFVSSV